MKRLIATDKFIEVNLIHIDYICKTYIIPDKLIKKYFKHFNIYSLGDQQTLKHLTKVVAPINNNYLNLLKKYRYYIDWSDISSTYQFTIDEIIFLQHELNVDTLMRRYLLNSVQVRKVLCSKIDWRLATVYYILTENELLEYKDKINWEFVTRSYKLSESFIRENIELFNINRLVLHQKLSKKFIDKFKHKLSISIREPIFSYDYASTGFSDDFNALEYCKKRGLICHD